MLRFPHLRRNRWVLLQAAIDLLILVASVDLAVRLRYLDDPAMVRAFLTGLTPRALGFALFIGLGLAAMGLYGVHLRESAFGVLARSVVGFVLGSVGLFVLYYALPDAHIGRGVFGIALLIGVVLVGVFRLLFMRLIDGDAFKRRIVVLGAGQHAYLIVQHLRRRSDRRGFVIVGFVPMSNEAIAVPHERVLAPDQPLSVWAGIMRIDEIVVGPDDRRGHLPMDDLLDCKQSGVAVTELATFFERECGKVKLALAEPSWLVFTDGFHATPLRMLGKRAFDLIAASAVLLLAWPFMLLVVLALGIESRFRAPALYRQRRVGERGRLFDVLKFRSMRTDAEKDGIARWASANDDRVTRVGRVIRKLRLDEVPQLWNVLKGEMSFIGPRPERPHFVDELSRNIRHYALRHCVKPGLTGWAQLRYPYGASQYDAEEKLKFDLYYVKNHNLLLDLVILIQTVEVVLFGRGAR